MPPGECDWTFEKTTNRFLATWPSSILHAFRAVIAVDIPIHRRESPQDASPSPVPPKTGYLNIQHKCSFPSSTADTRNVFVEQACLALRSLIASAPSSLPSTRTLLAHLPYAIPLLNTSPHLTPPTLEKTLFASLSLPSQSVRSFVTTLWEAITPLPSISFSHSRFQDDYYLRFYNRLKLCESLFIRFVVATYRHSGFEVLAGGDQRMLLHNIHKVMRRELEAYLPCCACLAIRTDREEGGVMSVYNRSAYRNERQTQPLWCGVVVMSSYQLPCILAQKQHDGHQSVFVADYRWAQRRAVERRKWLLHHHDHYTWRGDYRKPGIQVLDEEEFRQRVLEEVAIPDAEFALRLDSLVREGSTVRQTLLRCEEEDVERIHEEDAYAVFVPYCCCCWRRMDAAVVRKEGLQMTEEDAMHFSAMDTEWFAESVYLVRCSRCRANAAPSSFHFASTFTPFAIDGVPSLYLPSLQNDQICPLCTCLLHYFQEPKETKTVERPQWHLRIPPSERARVRTKLVSTIRFMDEKVGAVRLGDGIVGGNQEKEVV